MRYLLALLLFFSAAVQAAEPDLLEPEQAFRFSARVLDGQTIEARYQIADGYYLYKEKIKFQAEPADTVLGTPQLPAGKVKQDEYFGKVETYRGNLVIRLPYTRGSTGQITLKSVSQGCADAGVCYPPQTQAVKLDLPAARAEPAAAKSSLFKLLGGGGQEEFLSPEEAFKLTVKAVDANTLQASFTVAKTYYLYRDKIKFALKDAKGASIDAVTLPRGDIKSDPNFGKTEVYHGDFQALIKLKRDGSAAAGINLAASYQGCSEKGVCYPPAQKTFSLSLPEAAAAEAGKAASEPAAAAPAVAAAPAPDNDSSRIGALFKGGNFWLIIVTFFGFGLLLALTPCVFPMIPILSGIIVGQGQHLTKSRAFVLSLAYVLGMAITYAAAGVAAGMSGELISNALQNPWVLGGFALVFVVLALSMFDLYELQMPSFIQSRVTEASNRMHGGHLVSVFGMGALSAIIVGPCVAAPLAGALLYIGQTHDVVLGGAALFSLSLGMGAPLLLVGVSAGALLPRAGGWMQAVKGFFGVLLLGVAIWLVSPVISTTVHMLLWAALLIVSAIYLRALDPLPHPVGGFDKFWKGVGVIALIAGVALLIGVLSGSRDILQPLSGLRAAPAEAKAAEVSGLKFERVSNLAELERRVQQARGKIVMLDFFADWCVSCKEFERFTFADARVQARLRDVLALQVDVTANSAEDKALLKKFGLFGPPGIIFFDRDGKEMSGARVVGYEPPEKFLATLDGIIR